MAFTRLRDEIEMVFPAEPASLAQIRRALAKAASHAGLTPDRIQILQIACGEAATNAVEHAYRGQTGTVHLRTFHNGDRYCVEIEDHGRWRKGSGHGSGHGIPVMRGFVDEVDITQHPTGTRVRLAIKT